MISFLLTGIYFIFEKSKAMRVSLGKNGIHKKQKNAALR